MVQHVKEQDMPERGDLVLLTSELANRAMALAAPTIRAILSGEGGPGKRDFISVALRGYDGEVLAHQRFGSGVSEAEGGETFMARCDQVAANKGRIHFEEGMPSAIFQDRRPGQKRYKDTVFGGSAEYEGIIVSASGIQPHFDEAISIVVAGICWGLLKEADAQHAAAHVGEAFFEEESAPADA